jgi:hypothetical protein
MVTQKGVPLYTSGSCCYSDRSGTDRTVGGRVIHWYGPERRALF